jgi:hypothetical protein
MSIEEHLDKIRTERERQGKYIDLEKLVGTREEAVARHEDRLKMITESAKKERWNRGPGLPRRVR